MRHRDRLISSCLGGPGWASISFVFARAVVSAEYIKTRSSTIPILTRDAMVWRLLSSPPRFNSTRVPLLLLPVLVSGTVHQSPSSSPVHDQHRPPKGERGGGGGQPFRGGHNRAEPVHSRRRPHARFRAPESCQGDAEGHPRRQINGRTTATIAIPFWWSRW
ncbi:hypothetical protein B0T24DRAFT_49465 [Lasiosphaeria ovina]|uniref:Uncharacterized protein n=1 Tax=Lasiosphaeria ovina TaxID=92902 RepID=A0AAE0NL44_9PEZI|nr:hypothetical protein B0T24DRAFT_49465 [Lasiosphaeria ovina]